MKNKIQLLCTFSDGRYSDIVGNIKSTYRLIDKKIFVFQNAKNDQQTFLTYNIDRMDNKKLRNTISIHRKKESNTLYTIDAMNEIIKEETGGNIEKSHIIDWNLYKNCLILTAKPGYKIIELKLIDLIKI